MGKTDHLRFTIYDLRFVNLARQRRGNFCEAGAGAELRNDARKWLERGGGAKRRLCTRYDVRCTIAKFARVARGCGANARRNFESHARAWLERGGGGWRRLCTMDDVRCTIY